MNFGPYPCIRNTWVLWAWSSYFQEFEFSNNCNNRTYNFTDMRSNKFVVKVLSAISQKTSSLSPCLFTNRRRSLLSLELQLRVESVLMVCEDELQLDHSPLLLSLRLSGEWGELSDWGTVQVGNGNSFKTFNFHYKSRPAVEFDIEKTPQSHPTHFRTVGVSSGQHRWGREPTRTALREGSKDTIVKHLFSYWTWKGSKISPP